MNILEEAHNIIYERGQEKTRNYGPMNEMIEKTAEMASLMSNQKVDPDVVFCVLVALKLTREGHTHRYDNILDAIAYLAAWNDYQQLNNK